MNTTVKYVQKVHQKGKTLPSIHSKYDSHENRVGSRHNLSDDRYQHGDPIIGHFPAFVNMYDPSNTGMHNRLIYPNT